MDGDPLTHMKSAAEYAKHDAHLDGLALGVVGLHAISVYNSQVEGEMKGNLDNGVKTIEKIANGLAQVAINYGKANVASTINPPNTKVPYRPVTESGTDWTKGEIVTRVATALGSAAMVKLVPAYRATVATLSTSTVLEPMSMFALVVWLMFSPEDEQVDRAHETWVQVEKQLTSTKTSIDKLNSNWLSPVNWKVDGDSGDGSRQKYDEFMANVFGAELEECIARTNKTYTNLQKMKDGVNTVQLLFMAYSMAILAVIIVCWVASFYPPLKPAAEAIKKVCAGALGVASGCAMTGIGATVGSLFGDIFSLWIGTQDAFPANKLNPDGETTNFKDVNALNLTWTRGQHK